MTKQKLIQLRCHAWGIDEDEYYVKQCGDFEIEDMCRAYRRGRNKTNEELKEAKDIIEDLLYYIKSCVCARSSYYEMEQDVKRAEKFLEE